MLRRHRRMPVRDRRQGRPDELGEMPIVNWERSEIARPEAGPFRAFLLHTLNQFLSSEREREGAKKRGGRSQLMQLDTEEAEVRFAQALSEQRTPENEFERSWALRLIDRVMDRLKREARRGGQAKTFERLRIFLTDGGQRGSYREVAVELGMTESAVKAAVHRLRRRFGRFLLNSRHNVKIDGRRL